MTQSTPTPATLAAAEPMRLIPQEHANACSVAAVAMVTGLTYAEMVSRFALDENRLSTHGFIAFEWDHWLAELGWAVQRVYVTDCRQNDRPQWPPAPWAERHLCEVRAVEGANCLHLVVMDGTGKVFDPLGRICRLTDYPKVYNVAACVPAAATNHASP